MSDEYDTNTAVAERPAKPVDIVRHALERLKPQLAMALPKHLTPDRLVRIAMTAVQRTPKLLECDKTSFYGAIMTAAQLGLEPDGVLGQAYLIPFGGKVQFIPGYKGLLTLARNSGEISYIAAHEVREKDQFDFDFASGEPPVHKFSLKEDRGEVIAFYAIARFRDSSFHWDMMTTAEVDLIRDNSSGYQSARRYAKNGVIDSPWVGSYVEMGKKTVIRRLAKYLPLSVQKAAEIDAQVNAGMHVSLDRYGDIVIEGEAKEVAEDEGAAKTGSKLDRFDERHGPSDGDVPRGTIDADTGEIIDDTETRSNDAAARQDAGTDAPPSAAPRPGDPTPAAPATGAQSHSPAGPSLQPQQTDERAAESADHPAESAGPQTTTTAAPAGEATSGPLFSDQMLAKRRKELRGGGMTLPATYILIALWPIHGQWVERQEPATTLAACEVAAVAAVRDIGRPLDVDGPAREARCTPGDLFKPGWHCIEGYNCRG